MTQVMGSARYTECDDPSYATAVGGSSPGYTSTGDSEPFAVGEDFAGYYLVYEGVLEFDTSAIGAPPTTLDLVLTVAFGTAPDEDATLLVSPLAWTTPWTGAQWRDPSELTAIYGANGAASYLLVNGNFYSSGDPIAFSLDPSWLVVGGTTKLIVYTIGMRDAVTPTGQSHVFFEGLTYGSNPPVLNLDAPPGGPAVTAVSPNTGDVAGADSITITGTGFTGATEVRFGGTLSSSFVVDSDTQITADSPPHVAGTVHIIVTTPSGSSAAGAPDLFDYTSSGDPPTITDVTPSSGSAVGGTGVVILGTGFSGATDVSFGGTSASFVVNTDTQITATAPAHAAGAVSVTVDTPSGTSSPSGSFTYTGGGAGFGSGGTTACPVAYNFGGLLLDETTPDGDGIVWGVESLDGWWGTEPVRFETVEGPGSVDIVTVAKPQARQLTLTAFAFLAGGLAIGDLAYSAIATMKAVVEAALATPTVFGVEDPSGTLSTVVRLNGVMKTEIVGNRQLVKFTVPLVAPDPVLA